MATLERTADIGVLPGHEDHRGQSSDLQVQLEAGGPYGVDGEETLTITQTVLYPARQDRRIQSELPLYKAKELYEELGERIAEAESQD